MNPLPFTPGTPVRVVNYGVWIPDASDASSGAYLGIVQYDRLRERYGWPVVQCLRVVPVSANNGKRPVSLDGWRGR